jgi:hypothetical protein
MEFWTGFIYHFNTRLVTTLKYSAIINLYTLQITTAHANSFRSALTRLFPVTELNDEGSLAAPTISSLHRLPYNGYNISARTAQKHRSLLYSKHFLGNMFVSRSLPSNCCVYSPNKYVFSSSECCFELFTQ